MSDFTYHALVDIKQGAGKIEQEQTTGRDQTMGRQVRRSARATSLYVTSPKPP